jgi:hypothetical protein
MKHLKLFNENFFDRLENTLKGKSEKGKLLAEILKKNNLPEKGFLYMFRFMGGSDLTSEEKSHPISYLVNYKPNAGKLKIENGKMMLTDESFKNKKVVNIIPMIDKEEKEGVEEHGRIWSSMVIKANYSFDLSQEDPVLTFSDELLFDIDKGTWVKHPDLKEDFQEILDGEISEAEGGIIHALFGQVWNKELVTTYQNFIDECNKRKDIVDIISKHKEETPEVKESLITKKFKKFK